MIILISLLVICILMLITAIVYLIVYKRAVKEIAASTSELSTEKTNQLLTAPVPDREISDLVRNVNSIIEDDREKIRVMEKKDRLFRESITSISHDLRTPLTTAGGYIQMIKNGEVSSEEISEFIGIVAERQNSVTILLEQLFEYARIESGEMKLEPEKLDFNRELKECIALYYSDFDKKKAEPYIDIWETPLYVMADKKCLKRIFSNIIYNGIVHGETGYVIKTEQHRINNIPGVLFSFANDSEKISKEDLENIFQRFYIVDKSRNSKTTGLGLSIVRQLTEKMDGRVWAEYENCKICVKLWLKNY